MYYYLLFTIGFTLYASPENAITGTADTKIIKKNSQLRSITVEKAFDKLSNKNDIQSALRFVKTFYKWYLPKLKMSGAVRPSELALKQKKSAFDPQLFNALLEDYRDQDMTAGEIVGIDFDPFLSAQDPGEHYEVGETTREGSTYYVDVFESLSDKENKIAAIRAEVVKRNGQWYFVNFHYPKTGSDLLSILKLLSGNRKSIK